MRRCPLTYDVLRDDQRYAPRGVRRLSPALSDLNDLPWTGEALRREALARADKLSIQGVQPKASARINSTKKTFELVDTGGTFILKPPHADYPDLPANEDLTMRMAQQLGIEVPLHGLVYTTAAELVYFIKRFDRYGRGQKRAVEDFAQLGGFDRETKYASSMERIAELIRMHCTFPLVELEKLFVRTLFSFVVGNEDMHMKNFSVITRGSVVALAPAYDLLSTTLVLGSKQPEELALPLRGRKRRLRRADLVDYFARERLALPAAVVDRALAACANALPGWLDLIAQSFLPAAQQAAFTALLRARLATLMAPATTP